MIAVTAMIAIAAVIAIAATASRLQGENWQYLSIARNGLRIPGFVLRMQVPGGEHESYKEG